MSTRFLPGPVQEREPFVQTIGDRLVSLSIPHCRKIRAPERKLKNKILDPLPGYYCSPIPPKPGNNLPDLILYVGRWDHHADTSRFLIAPPGVISHCNQWDLL